MGKLDGKVAIVTGASGGIGRAIAAALAAEGASIAAHYASNREAAETLVGTISEGGGKASSIQADLAEPEGAQRLVTATLEAFGKIDILVNNAGILRDTLVLRMKDEDWQAVLDTNLSSAFYCTKAVLRELVRQRGGRIINIASVVAETGNAGQANYVAAKAGMIGFTKAVAREVASRGITVNAVAPGFVETRMTGHLSPEQVKMHLEQVPLGRAGKPEEIAAAVVFLASDDASYITGQVLNVDGGLVMR